MTILSVLRLGAEVKRLPGLLMFTFKKTHSRVKVREQWEQ